MLGMSLGYFEVYILVTIFIFGAIIGSFLNVVIYRFHTGKSISGSSHCMSCQRKLTWYELFPLFSYIVLRGKCRTCRSYIPLRYFLVELLTGLMFFGVYVHGGPVFAMFLYGVLLACLLIIAVYDIYHYVIPDELVVTVGVIVLLLYGIQMYGGFSANYLIISLSAALGAFLFYGTLWKVSKGRWIGLGDAKLSVPLAFLAGYPAVFSMIVLSFWIGAICSVLLISFQYILKRGQIHLRFFGSPLTMKSEIPFAPFLIVAFVLSYFYGFDVLSLVAYAL